MEVKELMEAKEKDPGVEVEIDHRRQASCTCPRQVRKKSDWHASTQVGPAVGLVGESLITTSTVAAHIRTLQART